MLIGNVGKDPEVRYLDGNGQNGQGTKVATFTLATSERYRDRSGELRENTEWHNIVAWRQSADIAEKFVKKGTQLYIEGRLRTRSWTDQSGAKRYTTEVTVDNLQLLGRRDDAAPRSDYQQPGYQPSSQSSQSSQPFQASQSGSQSSFQPSFQQAARQDSSPVTSAYNPDEAPTDDLPF